MSDITPQPEYIPNERVTAHEPPGELASVGRMDRDNFVRNMVTILTGPPKQTSRTTGCGSCEDMTIPISPSAQGLTPILTLAEIKLWLRIEPDQTLEDGLLTTLEMAAHLYTEDYLRQIVDGDAPNGVGEQIKI